MKRRIALAVIGSVVVALLLAGLGTLVLTRAGARRAALDELQGQAEAIAELVAVVATPRRQAEGEAPRIPQQALQRISRSFSVARHRPGADDGQRPGTGLVPARSCP